MSRLPEEAISKGSSPVFTEETLPPALCREHELRAKRWGVLHLLEGKVTFVDLSDGQERQQEMSAPDSRVVAPEAPHRLRLHGGMLRCRIDFYQEREKAVPRPEGVPPDLDTPERIEAFVRSFYARVQRDDLLAPVFVDQARVDWEEHIPKLTAFWCQIELGVQGYRGMPTQQHSKLSSVEPFRTEQFARWVDLFHDTVDRDWGGPHAQSIKERAVLIARAQSRVVQGAEPWSP